MADSHPTQPGETHDHAADHVHGPDCGHNHAHEEHVHVHGPDCDHEHEHDHGHDHAHGHHYHGHDDEHDHHHHASRVSMHSHGAEVELDFSIMLGISLLCGTFLLFGQVALWRQDEWQLASVCFILSVIVGGAIPLLEALPGLMQLRPDIDSLMVFAALGAIALKEPREGAVLMLLFSLSRALEAYAVGRTRQKLESLKEHWKESATRLRDGVEETVPITEIEIGDVLLVRPGERIPIDAKVVSGASAVNEAAITGEPMPVDKEAGDGLYGGTFNLQGSLTIEATAAAGESALARTLRLLEQAEEQEALTQRVVEWTTERYSTLVMLGCVFVITIPYLYFRQPLSECIYRGLSLLVVASPCALAVATPAAMFMAITAAAKRGILLKGGVHIEAAAAVRVVALDKTGTLTMGEPQVTGVHTVSGRGADDVLAIAAALERLSEHPLARPVVKEAEARGLVLPEATEFEAVLGRGVQGKVGGVPVWVGSPRWVRELGLETPALLKEIEAPLEGRGERALVVVIGEEVVGLIGMADTIRPEAAALVRDLKRTGIKRVVMLTGDTQAAAQAIADACGVDEVRAELLPGDKLHALEELKANYGRVVMVGDGINDAPALARADVGVAMGGIGSDLALESADVVLVRDDLWRLPAFLDLAKRATRMVLFNLFFALSVILVLVFIVVRGAAVNQTISLVTAVIAHEGSSMVVIANGMRLLWWKSRYDFQL
ncbi:MAG: cadmium-translocating P-type ATPase [Armatimonadetes bacterium]|nr:cadmium-translocating P-type ATPase [Armatimonadota bacterium]